SQAAAQPGAGTGRADRVDPERLERPERAVPPVRPLRGGPQPRINLGDDANANDTQRRLQEMLQQYPPSLGRVLALDPTLLTNDGYLQPYPQLETFLSQHPEVAHNPSFFFDNQYRELQRRNYDYNDPRVATIRAIDQALAGLAFLVGFVTVVLTIAWVVRSVM